MTDTIALFASAAMFGGLVFATFVLLPVLFGRWPADQAAPVARSVLPAYYLFVILTAGIAGLLLPPGPASVGLGAIVLIAVWIRYWALPSKEAAASDWLEGVKAAATGLNVVQLAIACLVLASFHG